MSRRAHLGGPRAFLLLLALGCAGGLGVDLFRVPVQYSDSYDAIARGCVPASAIDVFRVELHRSSGTLRPLRPLQARALCAVAHTSGLPLASVFRGTHVLLAALALVLLVVALPIEGWADVPAAGVALAALAGHHAVGALWIEAFPVNHYLEVLVATLLVLVAARTSPRRWVDAGLLVLLAALLLLFETALLIWVAVVLVVLLRLPGLTARTLALTSAVVAAYFATRFALGLTTVSLGSNGTGLWTTVLSASDLDRLTGAARAGMVVYNMAGAVLSILFSEPRGGVFHLLRAHEEGRLTGMTELNVWASGLTTLLLAWWSTRLLGPRHPALAQADRLGLVGVGLVLATAPFAAGYIKDEILAVGALGYACAVFAATRHLLARAATPTRAAIPLVLLVLIGSLWSVRAAGAHYRLAVGAFKTRNDWAHVTTGFTPDDARRAEARLLTTLRQDALLRRVTAPEFMPRWADDLWGQP